METYGSFKVSGSIRSLWGAYGRLRGVSEALRGVSRGFTGVPGGFGEVPVGFRWDSRCIKVFKRDSQDFRRSLLTSKMSLSAFCGLSWGFMGVFGISEKFREFQGDVEVFKGVLTHFMSFHAVSIGLSSRAIKFYGVFDDILTVSWEIWSSIIFIRNTASEH